MKTDVYRSTTLGEVCEKPQYGYTASAVREPVGPKFLRITDLQDQRIDWSTVPWCESNQADLEKFKLLHGDVLVARIGATTGSTSIVVDPPPSVFASYLIRLRPTPSLHPFFLYFYTKGQVFRDWIDAHKDSNLKGGVNVPVLLAAPLQLPSYSEQRRIAAILWKLERAITTQDSLIAVTGDLKQSAMQRLFTRGLRDEPLKDTEIGPMPESWQVLSLDHVANIRAGHPFPIRYQGTISGELPFYKVSDMNAAGNERDLTASANWISIDTCNELKAKTLPAGTTVFPKVGGALLTNKKRMLTRESVVDNNVMGVWPKSPACRHDYLFAWFESIDVAAMANPGPLPSLNAGRLKEEKVPLPGVDEQRDIAAAIATIDRKLAHHRDKRAALDDLFQATLHQLMTGQVRVADLDIDTSEVIAAEPQGAAA